MAPSCQENSSGDSPRLAGRGNVAVNRLAVGARLAILEVGGDFADGIMAYEANKWGGENLCPV